MKLPSRRDQIEGRKSERMCIGCGHRLRRQLGRENDRRLRATAGRRTREERRLPAAGHRLRRPLLQATTAPHAK
jgi:hypothetical protein